MLLKNKYVIGCHIMFYEIEMISDYIDSLINLSDGIENKENIVIDLFFNCSQFFERINEEEMSKDELVKKFLNIIQNIEKSKLKCKYKIYDDDNTPYLIGDYRRDLNYNNCKDGDFIIWGESDCLLPKETLSSIEQISEYASSNGINKYTLTFAVRKMWDESWGILEHPKFTNSDVYKHYDDEVWSERLTTDPASICYVMSNDEMNKLNLETDELDVRLLDYPKFDGSGLVISSDLIMNGVNVPHSTPACGEDTGFMINCKQLMGDNYKQFVIKNILKVHNRHHTKKRLYTIGEGGKDAKNFEKRDSNTKWKRVQEISEYNQSILGSSQEKFKRICM
tara:strand:+ start:485 stop:1495 length:1011 start_codon:yes stop_codon:yes gene_type:complete